jgi:hypothetical protein
MLKTVLEEKGHGEEGKENQNVAFLPYYDRSHLTRLFLEILFFFHRLMPRPEGTALAQVRAWIGFTETRE